MATEASRWWKSNQINRSSEATNRPGAGVEWRGGRGGLFVTAWSAGRECSEGVAVVVDVDVDVRS